MSSFWDQYLPSGDVPKAATDGSSSFWDQYLPSDPERPGKAAPDGRMTAPGTTTEQAADIPPGMVYDPRTGGYVDTALSAERMGQGQGASASFMAGAPFVGEFADEAMGYVDEKLTGRPREIATETMRQSREQFQNAHPVAGTAAEIAGGVVGSLPLAGPAARLISKAPGIAGKTIAAGAAGALGGAIEGAAAGYGRGRNNADRRQRAEQGAMIGAGVGGLVGALTPLVGAGAKKTYQKIRKMDVSVIADEFGVDRKTAGVLKKYLVNDDLDAAEKTLSAIGEDAMLADAGIGTSQALDTAAQTGGKALKIARERVDDRATASGQRLAQKLDDLLGSPDGVKKAAKSISARTAASRKAAYDKAFAQPIDYASPSGRKIEDVLSRIPPKTLRSAVDEANEAMIAAGKRNQQILAEIADDGSVAFRNPPNVQQLNEIKIALGNAAAENVDQFGRKTAKGIRQSNLAGELRDAVSEAVPSYKTAVKLGGDKIAEDKALDIGSRLLSARTTKEEVSEVMRGASAEARLAAQRGLRENIEKTLSNVRRTITDPNVDAREAMKAVTEMSSRANIAKVRLVLGDAKANALMDELGQAEAALALRSVIATNSKTAVRQAGQQALADATAPGAINTLMRGKPVEAGQKVIQALTGATDDASVAMRENVAAQIADALTGKRGRDAQRALRIVRQAMDGQPVKDAEAAFVSKVVAGQFALGGHQSVTQSLER